MNNIHEPIPSQKQTWLCGGSVEIMPCSHVGHLFREHAYAFEGDEDLIKSVNHIRFVEVWMDKYKEFYYAKNRGTEHFIDFTAPV